MLFGQITYIHFNPQKGTMLVMAVCSTENALKGTWIKLFVKLLHSMNTTIAEKEPWLLTGNHSICTSGLVLFTDK
jgi:hypothetical protein